MRRNDRGAVLALMAGSIVVLLGAGALAVDISARANTAQLLQNSADASALAGVVVWSSTSDAGLTQAEVNQVATQNGTDLSDITMNIDYLNPTTIRVNASDATTAGIFAFGTANNLVRSATATFDVCIGVCGGVIPIPEPFLSIDAKGSGDGFRPAVVGSKLYGVNHHSNTMACVDRLTQVFCFEDGDLFGDSSYETDWTVSEAVIGTRIFYLGQSSADIKLFCWETLTDTRCPAQTAATLPGGEFRGGAVVGVAGKIFAVTDDHRMRCFLPTGSTCGAYGTGGRNTGLGAIIAPLDTGNTVGNYDQVLDVETKRIYYSMKVDSRIDEGTYIDCWDTVSNSACGDFPAVKVDANPDKKGGRLFFYHLPRAAPTDVSVADGVCATNDAQISCYDFVSGAYQAGWGDNIEIGLTASTENGGTHINHPPTNRLVIQAKDLNLCWDFDAQTDCGDSDASSNKDYGFAYEGNCVFALGHNSNFHAFGMTSTEISDACPGTSSVARIDPCGCSGGLTWPNVGFSFDITPFSNFAVTFRDPNGNIVMGPIDMTAHPTGQLDLSAIPTTHSFLIVETVAEVFTGLPTSPWAEPDPPQITVSLQRTPHLIE